MGNVDIYIGWMIGMWIICIILLHRAYTKLEKAQKAHAQWDINYQKRQVKKLEEELEKLKYEQSQKEN